MLAATVDMDALLMPFFKIAFDILAAYKFTRLAKAFSTTLTL